ncbi:hypothetical protein C7B82_21750 [Stenomitos frigidus ULC18]|uniref:Uncharacterized protein n=1 Tax=Stenomitos frigidus ULC18 TaxID=2107698 RepID=A0A2T1DZA1_9CYAN|nr:hypothetical protein C7B82_21750 [Stenomitos frigidus ULC18]
MINSCIGTWAFLAQALFAGNTKTSARSIEMQKQIVKMSQQRAFLFTENTKMSARCTEMSKQTAV